MNNPSFPNFLQIVLGFSQLNSMYSVQCWITCFQHGRPNVATICEPPQAPRQRDGQWSSNKKFILYDLLIKMTSC